MIRFDSPTQPEFNQPKTLFLRPKVDREMTIETYVHMFQEDISNSLIPYFLTRQKTKVVAKLIGDESDIQVAQTLLAEIDSSYKYEQSEIILNAIRAIGRNVSWNGIMRYEILESQTRTAFKLHRISSFHLYKLPWFYVQLSFNSLQENVAQKVNLIDKSLIWEIKIPKELGGVRAYVRTLKALATHSPYKTNTWEEDNLYSSNKIRYDWKFHHEITQRARAIATKRWGWNQRNYETRGITEYYFFYRTVRFQRSVSIFRDSIVVELNKLFQRLKLNVSITLNGLYTAQDYDKVLADLREGSINFEDVHKTCYLTED